MNWEWVREEDKDQLGRAREDKGEGENPDTGTEGASDALAQWKLPKIYKRDSNEVS